MQLEGMDDVKAIVSACEDYGDDFDFKNFHGKGEVVATINDSETGNDVIGGRQLTGSPPPL